MLPCRSNRLAGSATGLCAQEEATNLPPSQALPRALGPGTAASREGRCLTCCADPRNGTNQLPLALWPSQPAPALKQYNRHSPEKGWCYKPAPKKKHAWPSSFSNFKTNLSHSLQQAAHSRRNKLRSVRSSSSVLLGDATSAAEVASLCLPTCCVSSQRVVTSYEVIQAAAFVPAQKPVLSEPRHATRLHLAKSRSPRLSRC